MKLVVGTKEQMVDLKLKYFDAGACFTAVLYNNYWDEATKRVYPSKNQMDADTFALESEYEYEGQWALKHIDDYVFAPYTYRHYMDTYPDNEAIQNRIPRDEEGEPIEEWLDKTPQQWVSEVIIGDNYTVID
jgi:hypothetical protein